jgi:guanylate kinase
MSYGSLFVLSAPSGAGKTSLVEALRASVSDFAVSVSHTTRIQRPGEQHGQAYYFVARPEFERMVAAGEFLEYACVFDNYYGTARRTVEELLRAGRDVLLEIDWQGARQIRTIMPECVSIFILPPSREALEHRLRGRGQDDAQTIGRRMREAISELSHYDEYDYLVVNDQFETALSDLRSIIRAQRLRAERQQHQLTALIQSLIAG